MHDDNHLKIYIKILSIKMMMQNFLLFSTLVLLAGTTQAEWRLVWQDEFNGNHVDLSQWGFEVGGNGWGNNELEFYTYNRTENARIENGNLVIDVHVEDYRERQFTSARMHTKQAWKYGRFEIRARMPNGHNLWPAIWMMPLESIYGIWAASGEVDIAEFRGDILDKIEGTAHYGGTWPNNIYSGSGPRSFNVNFSQDFHTFALEWDHKQLRWYMDNQQYFSFDIDRMLWSGKGANPYTKNGQPFDQPFYLMLNVAVGGNFFGPGPYVTPDQARQWPKHTFEIDYVRVYQQ